MLRRRPAKATVVDVARALGVSHGSVYRHFPTKAALREAVTGAGSTASRAAGGPARTEARADGSPLAPPLSLRQAGMALNDPELFATWPADRRGAGSGGGPR